MRPIVSRISRFSAPSPDVLERRELVRRLDLEGAAAVHAPHAAAEQGAQRVLRLLPFGAAPLRGTLC
jgi:hypothetical protein